MPVLVTMPKWGLTMQSGAVTGWIASEGETVSAGSPLLTVETEKAVNDVEAPADGVLYKIVTQTGDEAAVGAVVGIIAAPGETPSLEELAALMATATPVASALAATAGPGDVAVRTSRPATRDSTGRVNASPAARKRAAELGIDLALVTATGPGGRVTSDDIERAASDLELAAAAPTEVDVTTPNGTKIHALLAGPVNAKTYIVLLHGLGGSFSTWTSLLPELVSDARVAALDLPGHGDSDKADPSSFNYSVANLAAEIGEAIVALDLAPAIVVGHSLGGLVAMKIAKDRPKLVRGLVLINSAGFGVEVNGALLDLIEASPSRDNAREMLELFFEDKRYANERGISDMFDKRSRPGADEAMKAIAAAAFSREGQLAKPLEELNEFSTPVYILWGELDRVFPPGHAAAAANAIPGSWLDVISGSGHVPQVEAPARVAELIQHWRFRLPVWE